MKPLIFILLALLITVSGSAQDPDIFANEDTRMREIFRTSDQPGTVATGRKKGESRPKRMTAPVGSRRIGCVCMDDTRSDTRSSGACSGHGGVRFWVYKTPQGDTVHILTGRHEQHPHGLTADEMSVLNQTQVSRAERLRTAATVQQAPVIVLPPNAFQGNPQETAGRHWSDALFTGAGGVGAYLLYRLLSDTANHNNAKKIPDALRNLFRHRRRPTARQNRKNIGKKRMP